MNKFWKGLAISGLALSVVSAGSFVQAKGSSRSKTRQTENRGI